MSSVYHRVVHPATGTSMEVDSAPQKRTRVLEVVLPQRKVRREVCELCVQRTVLFLCQERLLGMSEKRELIIDYEKN